jgi:hypothetical protein
MPLKCTVLLCGESVTVDARRNSLSIFHLYEQFNLPTVPFAVPKMVIVGIFERSDDEASKHDDASFTLKFGDQELLRAPIDLNFHERPRLRQITEVGGIVVPGPGTLRVSAMLGGTELSYWEIRVLLRSKPRTETPIETAPAEDVSSTEVN